MRQKLETEIINTLIPYRDKLPLDEIQAQITIILNNYEVQSRCTELAIPNEEKNRRYLAAFLASKAAGGRSENTLKHYKSYLNKALLAMGKNADEVTPDDIKLYLAKKLRVDKISKVSVNNERLALSSFFGWMHNNEIIPKNPMNKVENVKFYKKKKYAFSDMDVEKIRNACRTERETMMIEVMLSTWCRVGELCGIMLDEIDSDRILVHGKGDKDRIVYLNAKAQMSIQKYLAKRKDKNPYLLPKCVGAGDVTNFQIDGRRCNMATWYECPDLVDAAEPCDKGTIESIVRNIGKRAGVKNTHPHRFRRTGATMALRTGMPIMTVSKLLGHANIAVTQVYLDISDETLENEHGKYVR